MLSTCNQAGQDPARELPQGRPRGRAKSSKIPINII